MPAPAKTRAVWAANWSLRLRASQPTTTPAAAACGSRPRSQLASAAVVAVTVAVFIRLGPAATTPRNPAVPKLRRPLNLSVSSAAASGELSASSAARSALSSASTSWASQSAARARVSLAATMSAQRGQDRGEQLAQARCRLVARRHDVAMIERLLGQAGGDVGDQRDAQHPGAEMTRGDCFEDSGHADEAGADRP